MQPPGFRPPAKVAQASGLRAHARRVMPASGPRAGGRSARERGNPQGGRANPQGGRGDPQGGRGNPAPTPALWAGGATPPLRRPCGRGDPAPTPALRAGEPRPYARPVGGGEPRPYAGPAGGRGNLTGGRGRHPSKPPHRVRG